MATRRSESTMSAQRTCLWSEFDQALFDAERRGEDFRGCPDDGVVPNRQQQSGGEDRPEEFLPGRGFCE